MAERKRLGIDVLTASRQRISYVFDQFTRIYVSFSGGKDSTVMLHLVMAEAKKRNRKIGVLFIDWEVQYKLTIDHVVAMFDYYKDWIEPYWIALPLKTESAISVYEPQWICWDRDKKDLWVRQPPAMAITDEVFFFFYHYGMTFEEFVPAFGEWYATKGIEQKNNDAVVFEPTACFVGIRADESFNRLLKVRVKQNREYWNGKPYLLNLKSSLIDVVLAHPLYDWKTDDIWKYNGKYFKSYNKIYDLMYQAGVPISKQRIDEFFGPEARRGLWMLHEIESDTWARVTGRIVGCNSAALYAKEHGNINGDRRITKPEGHTWKSFAELLLASMPEKTAEHYKNKIAIYLHWYGERSYVKGIPDEQEQDLGPKDNHPSWRRICKVLLRNDYWCKALSFTPTKAASYENYLRVMRNRRTRWGMFV
jgi:predicted phosphoadenosine phosphosulfate sulfurtransferase